MTKTSVAAGFKEISFISVDPSLFQYSPPQYMKFPIISKESHQLLPPIKCRTYSETGRVKREKQITAKSKSGQLAEILEFFRYHLDFVFQPSFRNYLYPESDSNSQTLERFPFGCVHELLNIGCSHMDSQNQDIIDKCITINFYGDFLEIASPGSLKNQKILSNTLYTLSELLAQLRWNPLIGFEEEDKMEKGIRKAIEDCRNLNSPEPVIYEKDGYIVATIYPISHRGDDRPDKKMTSDSCSVEKEKKTMLKKYDSPKYRGTQVIDIDKKKVPSLVIGCGGTGLWILSLLKRQLYINYDGTDKKCVFMLLDTTYDEKVHTSNSFKLSLGFDVDYSVMDGIKRYYQTLDEEYRKKVDTCFSIKETTFHSAISGWQKAGVKWAPNLNLSPSLGRATNKQNRNTQETKKNESGLISKNLPFRPEKPLNPDDGLGNKDRVSSEIGVDVGCYSHRRNQEYLALDYSTKEMKTTPFLNISKGGIGKLCADSFISDSVMKSLMRMYIDDYRIEADNLKRCSTIEEKLRKNIDAVKLWIGISDCTATNDPQSGQLNYLKRSIEVKSLRNDHWIEENKTGLTNYNPPMSPKRAVNTVSDLKSNIKPVFDLFSKIEFISNRDIEDVRGVLNKSFCWLNIPQTFGDFDLFEIKKDRIYHGKEISSLKVKTASPEIGANTPQSESILVDRTTSLHSDRKKIDNSEFVKQTGVDGYMEFLYNTATLCDFPDEDDNQNRNKNNFTTSYYMNGHNWKANLLPFISSSVTVNVTIQPDEDDDLESGKKKLMTDSGDRKIQLIDRSLNGNSIANLNQRLITSYAQAYSDNRIYFNVNKTRQRAKISDEFAWTNRL